MTYALDTNIVSFILRDQYGMRERLSLEAARGNSVVVPLVVYYESKRGLISSGAMVKLTAFEKLCKRLDVKTMEVPDMDVAAQIYADNKRKGRPIEDDDLLIAASCMRMDYVLVTNNTKHFEVVTGLNIVDWVEQQAQ